MKEQKEVLAAAHAALEDAFGPEEAAKHTVKVTSTPSHGLTSSDLNSIIEEVGGKPVITPIHKVIETCNQSTETPAKKKSIAESKKLIETFTSKLKNYPKHLSYEGSVVLCSLIGLKQTNDINLAGLPKIDQDLIYSQLPLLETLHGRLSFSVTLDDQQDFLLACNELPEDKSISAREFRLRFFNSVLRPNNFPSDIPIERDGEKVTVGGSLVLDPQRVQKLVGNTPSARAKGEDEELPRRQMVSGRNAFEIRTDILTLAVDWVNQSNGKRTEDEVLRVAKLFYSFVENRR
jgi:hypothetical protein